MGSALEGATVAQVKRLMHGRDAVDVAAWAHKVNKKYPWTTELHYQRQPADRCSSKELMKKPADLSNCPDNRCLVKGLKHFYGRLVNQQTVDIEWPAGMKLTDADCVKYLINLMGDLHQPMHFAAAENITVLFRGKESTLYDIWDKEITQAVMRDNPGFWWGGWTHVQRTRVEYEKDGAALKEDGVKLLAKWADETANYLCDNIYKNPYTGRQISEELQNGVFRLQENLYELWKREMLSKMLVAGARTAIVLNAILDQRDAANLGGGTAVQEIEGEEDDNAPKISEHGRQGENLQHIGNGVRVTQGIQAAGINLAIFVGVAVVFLQVTRTWQGTAAISQADQAKRGGGDGGKKT